MGTTHCGTPVWLNSAAFEADKLILTGGVTCHSMAGYGGRRKSIVPGIAGMQTICRNHAYSLDPERLRSNPRIGNGVLEDNPLNEDMCEAAGMMKALFMVNLVMNARMKLSSIFSGHYLTSWLRACREVDRIYRVDVPERADVVIDTTQMPAAKLRNELYRIFGDKSARGKLSVNVMSFGYKYGIPLEADLVFDVRFLPNPFYVPELKHKTGMDSEVYDYVFSFPQTKTFIDKLEGMLSFLLPLYAEEGKSTLVIAVGCTGGHHRSVSVARCLTAYLSGLGYPAFENHRDMTRG